MVYGPKNCTASFFILDRSSRSTLVAYHLTWFNVNTKKVQPIWILHRKSQCLGMLQHIHILHWLVGNLNLRYTGNVKCCWRQVNVVSQTFFFFLEIFNKKVSSPFRGYEFELWRKWGIFKKGDTRIVVCEFVARCHSTVIVTAFRVQICEINSLFFVVFHKIDIKTSV